jgi:hypothetical protein
VNGCIPLQRRPAEKDTQQQPRQHAGQIPDAEVNSDASTSHDVLLIYWVKIDVRLEKQRLKKLRPRQPGPDHGNGDGRQNQDHEVFFPFRGEGLTGPVFPFFLHILLIAVFIHDKLLFPPGSNFDRFLILFPIKVRAREY